jgi:hypothetical protein
VIVLLETGNLKLKLRRVEELDCQKRRWGATTEPNNRESEKYEYLVLLGIAKKMRGA